MVIKLENLSKEFKGVPVLEDVNLTLESGHIYGFVGPNGCGKSVLLKIICGFYQPTTGSVLFDGEDIIKKASFAPDTRALIERPSFIPYLTGYENLASLANIQKKIGKKEIEETLEKVNLTKDANKKYATYSLGMKQKLGIAQVLMEDPAIMLFDEPFNGIEEDTVIKIRKVLLEEAKKGKLTVVASHLKEDIEVLVDQVYKFDGGHVKLWKEEKKEKK